MKTLSARWTFSNLRIFIKNCRVWVISFLKPKLSPCSFFCFTSIDDLSKTDKIINNKDLSKSIIPSSQEVGVKLNKFYDDFIHIRKELRSPKKRETYEDSLTECVTVCLCEKCTKTFATTGINFEQWFIVFFRLKIETIKI